MIRKSLLLLPIFLILFSPTIAAAQSPQNTFVFTSTPYYYLLGGVYHSVDVPLENTQNMSEIGVVIGVAHNSIGQTEQVSSSTIELGPGANGTAYIAWNLPSGNYSVNIFVWSINGSVLSSKETIEISF